MTIQTRTIADLLIDLKEGIQDMLDGVRLYPHEIESDDQWLALVLKDDASKPALYDGLVDMVIDGRLTEEMIPDDYQWLIHTLSAIAALHAQTQPEDTYTWYARYATLAQLQGWDVFEDEDSGNLVICRIDAMNRFRDDCYAEDHVEQRAEAGCAVAIKALELRGKQADQQGIDEFHLIFA